MDRIILMSFTILCLMNRNSQGLVTTEVEELSSTSIAYVTSATQPRHRYWYRGKGYDGNNKPKGDDLIFTLTAGSSAWTPGKAAREGISADATDFSLSISKVQLEDDGFYSCKTTDTATAQDVYDEAGHLQIYIQPLVNIATNWEDENKENVTVTCTVPRLFPKITPDEFTMEWAGQAVTATLKENDIAGDLAKECTLSLTQKANVGKETVSCTVTPQHGIPATNKTTIDKETMSALKLTIGRDERVYIGGDNVDVSCTLVDGDPKVDLSTFKIDWEGHDFDPFVNITGPSDEHCSYRIQKSLQITLADDKKNVTCSAMLTSGKPLNPSPTKIMFIYPNPSSAPTTTPPPSNGLSAGGVAGVAVGSAVGGALLGGFAVYGCVFYNMNVQVNPVGNSRSDGHDSGGRSKKMVNVPSDNL